MKIFIKTENLMAFTPQEKRSASYGTIKPGLSNKSNRDTNYLLRMSTCSKFYSKTESKAQTHGRAGMHKNVEDQKQGLDRRKESSIILFDTQTVV